MIDRALIGWQIAAVGIVAGGWGFWLWRLAGSRAAPRRLRWLWWGIAGFAAHALLLQSLVYLNAPLRWTAWFGLAIGISGCGALAFRRIESKSPPGSNRLPEAGAVGVVVGIVMLIHLALPVWQGPARFFGSGRYDQANYVVTAQFLVDESFSTDGRSIGLRPWLTQPLEKKEERITQSVAHGALAAVSGGDVQKAYAATVAVFLALAAAATFGWLRGCAVPRSLAAVAGMLAATAAGVTRVALDGFFSQVATLFVLPALAAVLWPPRAIDRPARLMAALLLAFVVGAYTETAVVALGLLAALIAVQPTPIGRRGRDFAVIVGGALVLNPGYTMRLPAFLALQWSRARDPLHLATYFPDAGTWAGFGRVLIDVADVRLATTAGLVAGLLILAAMGRQPRGRRVALLATLAVPLLTLGLLLVRSPLPAYPFAKLTIGFTPLWVGFFALGGAAIVRHRPRALNLVLGLAVVALALGLGSTVPQYRLILAPADTLAILVSDGMAAARAEAAAHPERRYVVAHDDPLAAQWLCYFGRHAPVYLDRRHLGDRVVTTEACEFRRLPAAATELWWLDPQHAGRYPPHEAGAVVSIIGATVSGETDRAHFYLVGESLQVALTRETGATGEREAWLDLALTPLPAVGPCRVEFSNTEGGRRQVATAQLGGWMRFRVQLPAGRSDFALRVQPAHPVPRGEPLGLLQAVSVEPVNRQVLSSDPVPAAYVD